MMFTFYDRHISIRTASSDKHALQNWAGLGLASLPCLLSATAPFAQYAARIFLVNPSSHLTPNNCSFPSTRELTVGLGDECVGVFF
jgi:hypothetical protein